MNHLDRLPQVAEALRGAGMTIQDQVSEIGQFSGLTDEKAVPALEAVPGVRSVHITGNEGEPDPTDYSIS